MTGDVPQRSDSNAVRQARRRLASVVVEGLSGPGLRLAEHLVAAGVGTLVLRDDQPVTPQDAGFRSVDAGRNRAEAAAELLSVRAGETAVVEAPTDSTICGADLHILAHRCAAPDAVVQRGLHESPAVLPVLVTDSGWRVGPLLLQDSLLCSACLGIGRLACGTPGDGTSQPDASAGPLEEAAAAVGAHQVAVLLDGVESAAIESAGLLADAATGGIAQIRPIQGYGCACTAA